MNKNTGLLTRKELENNLEEVTNKYTKLNKLYNMLPIGIICFVSSFIVSVSFENLPLIGISVTALIATAVSEIKMSKKLKKIANEVANIQYQLDDIVSVEFEKKRYSREKKYNNTSDKNNLIESIIEERQLLEKYKQDLNQYAIHSVDDELKNEINTRNYTLQKLNQLK